MARFTDNQVQLGMCMGVGDADFDLICDLVDTTRTQDMTIMNRQIPDWRNFIFKIREKLSHPYTFQKELDIHDMLREWREFSKDLIEVVQEAHTGVEKCITGVSHQREQTLAVTGRLLWGTLTLFVPPPVGVLLGAFIYAATEKQLTGGLQKFVEWGMQTPQSYADPGQVAPRRRPNQNAPSNNSGGHGNIRDLKDINQMIKSVEKMFGGERGKWLKELNETTLRKLVHVPDLSRGVSQALEGMVTSTCEQGVEFLKRALVDEMIALIGNDRKLRRIAEASYMLQLPFSPEVKPRAVIREGVILFLNRLAHEQVEAVKAARGAERPPSLGAGSQLRNDLKRKFQVLLFASYFNANRETYDPTVPTANPSFWQQLPGGRAQPRGGTKGEHFAAMFGVVPNSFFSSSYAGTFMNSLLVSPLEETLTKLGIIRKTTNETEIALWSAADITRPVPYTTIDRAFRGRLRAWADHYCGDHIKTKARGDEIVALFFASNAPQMLRVS